MMTVVETHEGVGVMRLVGRFEAGDASGLMQRCLDMWRGGCPKLVLNLSAVTFIASSGIGTLLALREALDDRGGALRLAALSDPVASVIGLLNLTAFLPIDQTEDEAIATLGGE
ncbi:MAG: STAS domain-containing protein [Candidatus Eiseniibacteriota bacterium]|jgi:anti-anti-sigma factor